MSPYRAKAQLKRFQCRARARRASHESARHLARQPILTGKALNKCLGMVQKDLDEESTRLGQKKTFLAGLEKAILAGEAEVQHMQHRIVSLQTQIESNGRALAMKDSELAGAKEAFREKCLLAERLKESERRYEEQLRELQNVGAEKERSLKALRTDGEVQAGEISSLKIAVKDRDERLKALEATEAEKEVALGVLCSKVHQLQEGVGPMESNKRARVD